MTFFLHCWLLLPGFEYCQHCWNLCHLNLFVAVCSDALSTSDMGSSYVFLATSYDLRFEVYHRVQMAIAMFSTQVRSLAHLRPGAAKQQAAFKASCMRLQAMFCKHFHRTITALSQSGTPPHQKVKRDSSSHSMRHRPAAVPHMMYPKISKTTAQGFDQRAVKPAHKQQTCLGTTASLLKWQLQQT